MFDCLAAFIQCEYFATLSEEIDQIAPVSAPGIEHPHSRGDISSKNLIEDVDIDLSKLLLNTQRHV